MANNSSKPTNVETVKRCVLMGLNYTGTENELRGCINDSINLRKFMIDNKYFKENEITMMNDNSTGKLLPIKVNILMMFDELVAFANANKNKNVLIFIGYSGHGSSQRRYRKGEMDNADEVLVNLDYDTKGGIVDDVIRAVLIDRMPKNAKLVILMDCCHSRSLCDIKYLYDPTKPEKFILDPNHKDTVCDVVCISGCADNDVSADAYLPNAVSGKYENCGACTTSFIKNYKDEIPTDLLMANMRSFLKRKQFKQVVQLSSGKKIDTTMPFILSKYND